MSPLACKVWLLQVQIGTKCYVVDVLQANAGAMHQLKLLLEDTNVTKVVHDSKQDLAALHHQKGIGVTNTFDTKICH